MDRGWIWRVGVLVVFGLGGGAGGVFAVRGAKSFVATAWFILESTCSYPIEQEKKLIDYPHTSLTLASQVLANKYTFD